MKRFIAILLACLMVFGLVACGGGGDDTPDPTAAPEATPAPPADTTEEEPEEEGQVIRIAYLSAILTHNYFATVAAGMRDRIAEIDADIEFQAHDANLDPTAQLDALENFITLEFDAIIISPLDGAVLEEAVTRARERGIIVISQAQGIETATLNYVLDEYDYGFAGGIQAGQWIVDELDGEADVAILTTGNIRELEIRANGIIEGILSVAPNANIVSEQPGNLLELGMTATETILQAHPSVRVIASVNDAGALGATEAIQAMGMATDDFFVGGLDAADEALDRMEEEGSIFRATVSIAPFDNGRRIIDWIMRGVTEGVDVLPPVVLIDMVPVTQEQLRAGEYQRR